MVFLYSKMFIIIIIRNDQLFVNFSPNNPNFFVATRSSYNTTNFYSWLAWLAFDQDSRTSYVHHWMVVFFYWLGYLLVSLWYFFTLLAVLQWARQWNSGVLCFLILLSSLYSIDDTTGLWRGQPIYWVNVMGSNIYSAVPCQMCTCVILKEGRLRTSNKKKECARLKYHN